MSPILQLANDDPNKEREFELRFLMTLTIQQRFKMMLEKSQEMRKLLKNNARGKTAKIITRT